MITKKEIRNRSVFSRNLFVSGLGGINVKARAGKICSVSFAKGKESNKDHPLLKAFCNELDKYFQRKTCNMDKFEPDIEAYTSFEKKVFSRLRKVRYGQLISYGELARSSGSPRAGRAIGNAVGKNRTPILIPCHRVVKSDGSVGGFSLGQRIKKKLLNIENADIVFKNKKKKP